MNKIVDNGVDPEYQWLTKKQVFISRIEFITTITDF